jgi:predicted permease
VLLYGGLPMSASAYVLARLLGGDATLMAGALTVSTLAAFLTLPVVIALTH